MGIFDFRFSILESHAGGAVDERAVHEARDATIQQ
jgi:hypothetical protein